MLYFIVLSSFLYFPVHTQKTDVSNKASHVLVFAPHPDDDVIGCGGSIAKHVKSNHTVTIVYMTSGEAGLPKLKEKKMLARIREQEAQEAAAFLGVNDLIFLRYPNMNLRGTEEILTSLIAILKEKNPDIVYVPHANDEHKDHQATHKLVIQAIAQLTKEQRKNLVILGYEVWTPLQHVSYTVNISEYIELKMKAIQQHQSQIIHDKPYDEAIKGLNRYRGIMKNKGEYCECFAVYRVR